MSDLGFESKVEKGQSSGGGSTPPFMTLAKAVDMGEYNPEYLANFAEWHTLSRHVQFEMIKTGLDNRNKQLVAQWAEINNFLDFSKKPNLQKALDSIVKQWKDLQKERERLFLEYS
jgi:hypothetical protein